MNDIPEFRVGELGRAVKSVVEHEFGRIRVRGEIVQPKRHASGHVYLRLSDADGVLEAVCWKGVAQRLHAQLQDGLEVVATGRLTTYAPQSKYQLVIEMVEPAGIGALLQLLAARKEKLQAEGLLDAARKRPLPFMPDCVGIITSPTGAVIQDMLHRLRERLPVRVLLWPVAVQGERAAAEITAALRGMNQLPADWPKPAVLIVARGGGSFEDLLPFHDEALCRAAAASAIPVISAIGHETDVTLLDFVADRRAPTPTAAAEMLVPVRAELLAQLATLGLRLQQAVRQPLAAIRTRLNYVERLLAAPQRLLETPQQRLDDLTARLTRALPQWLALRRSQLAQRAAGLSAQRLVMRLRLPQQQLVNCQQRLSRLGQRLIADRQQPVTQAGRTLELLSYRRTLARGFVLVQDRAGLPVTAAAALAVGAQIRLQFAVGTVGAVVTDPASADAATTTAPAEPAPRQRLSH